MKIETHIYWDGATHLAGQLHTGEAGSAVTFAYAPSWLARPGAFAIDPTSLPLRAGPQHSPRLFGALQDCGPDRWGRLLIERAVRQRVLEQRPYQDMDYILALDDATRLGALRFRTEAAGPFLAESQGKLPPLVKLSSLLRATDAIHEQSETAADLRFLLGAGSPLGGARPKAAVCLADGRLALAKFPRPDDQRDIAAGEVLALRLARHAGITVAEHRLVTAGGHAVSVVTRFDRSGPDRRPFLSAHSLLALQADDPGSYTGMADGIRQFGHEVAADLRELWRRLVFSLLASNYDDHLRNHGFLMLAPGRWALSPAYDLNPVPEIDRRSTPKCPISESGGEATLAGALAAAPRFGLSASAARAILREVTAAVSAWRQVGRSLRLTARTLQAYETAFVHPTREEAERLG